jgi:hypothetical protein
VKLAMVRAHLISMLINVDFDEDRLPSFAIACAEHPVGWRPRLPVTEASKPVDN